jgi:rare lipoprotein A
MRLFTLFILTTFLLACANNTTRSTAPISSPTDIKTKKSGGYYLDDGPGDNPPANIEAIPDAVPKVEVFLDRANKPYMALGNAYTPMTKFTPYKKSGVASWYGRRYHGKKTSTGEVYDMYGMTGAHPVLPLPSYVRVTNPVNQKSVIVRINDRGPFHSERLIDLSYAAAYKLDILGKGSGLVEVEAIDPRTYVANKPVIKPVVPVEVNEVETKPLESQRISADMVQEVSSMTPEKVPATASGVFVQVGAFKLPENASGLSKKIVEQNLVENAPVKSWFNDGVYRVRIGPYSSRTEADRTAAKIKDALGLNSYIVVQP